MRIELGRMPSFAIAHAHDRQRLSHGTRSTAHANRLAAASAHSSFNFQQIGGNQSAASIEKSVQELHSVHLAALVRVDDSKHARGRRVNVADKAGDEAIDTLLVALRDLFDLLHNHLASFGTLVLGRHADKQLDARVGVLVDDFRQKLACGIEIGGNERLAFRQIKRSALIAIELFPKTGEDGVIFGLQRCKALRTFFVRFHRVPIVVIFCVCRLQQQ